MKKWRSGRPQGTLGLNASTFRDVEVGCVGATVPVLFTAGVTFGLVVLLWWVVLSGG